MTNLSKREQLVEVALELFSKNGYHATGIDLILKEAGIAKKTLYNHFQSKEELIVEVLVKHDEAFRNFVQSSVDELGKSPEEKLLAIFDVAHEWFSDKKFYGCMFINAIGEYSDSDTEIRKVCKDFKNSMMMYFLDLCKQAGYEKPKELAEELALLLEGSIVTAQVSQTPKAAMIAKRSAKILMGL